MNDFRRHPRSSCARDASRASAGAAAHADHDAARLREALGGAHACPRILIKRDDLTALGLGGNKARKLEYLVADALAQGRDHADHDRRRAVQSRPHDGGGGVRDRHAVCAGADRDDASSRRSPATCCSIGCTAPRCDWCRRSIRCWPSGRTRRSWRKWSPRNRRAGRVPYVIPVGGSSGIGVFGYVERDGRAGRATVGIAASRRRGCITRADHAARRRALHLARGYATRRTAFAVLRSAPASRRRSSVPSALPTKRPLDWACPSGSSLQDLVTDQWYIGEGYGIPTVEAWRRSSCWRGPKRSCSIRVTRRKRWPR